MIVCHTFNYIFLKPKKVAGTSVQIALAGYCTGRDQVNKFSEEEIDQRPWLKSFNNSVVLKLNDLNPKSKWYQRVTSENTTLKDSRMLGGHVTALKLKRIIKPAIWNSYYKFTIVRNPWDQQVSRYYQKLYKWTGRGNAASEFPEFSTWIVQEKQTNENHYFDRHGNPILDFYIRFETLQTDYNTVCDTLGIPRSTLPRAKSKYRTAIHKTY